MQPSDLFTALFEIYNLVSIIPSDGPPHGSILEDIELLNKELEDNFEDTFYPSKYSSKRTKNDTDESSPSKRSKGGNTGNGSRHGEHVYHDHQVVGAFTRVGYTLELNDEDKNGWAPLNQVKQPSTLSVDLN